MNYEQKYKEALERARVYHMGGSISAHIAEVIFPELKESEDERIRQGLINGFNECLKDCPYPQNAVKYWHDIDINQILTWLEKQGEQPTDKIDTKFKVGDWIVQAKIGVYKVIEICESWYEVVDNKDNHYSIGFDKEYMCHLWTINDAKDGDVLVTGVDKNPFIFKGLLDSNHPNCPVAYCGIDPEGYFCVSLEKYWWTDDKDDVQPATKEQRDLLFQKMKEAGYEWDAEKKELKKIVDKSSWSEQDERNLKGVIDEIEANKNSAPDCDLATHDRFLSCLKSIRQRIGV